MKMLPSLARGFMLCAAITVSLQFIVLQSFGQNGNIAGTVSDQYGPLPGAEIAIEGTNITARANMLGEFILEGPAGSYMVRASYPLYQSRTRTAVIQDGGKLKLDFILASRQSDENEVAIGSRAHPRSLLETAVPVDVISARDIANSSQVELSQVLQYLSPSFHSTRQTIADGTDHVDPATLRGLGPDQVLVLINGKRRHNSSLIHVNGTVGRGTVGTDLNSIPVSAIERIEILRDGAAAQYGSDAIAGVINIILKKETDIAVVSSTAGISTEGDGGNAQVAANYGFKIGEEGYLNFTAEFRKRGSVNRSGDYTGNIFSTNDSLDALTIAGSDFFEQTGYSGERVMEIGHAATTNTGIFFNSEVPVSENASFYAFGGRSFRIGHAKGFFRFPLDQRRVITDIHPNGFSPSIHSDILDMSITAGMRGMLKNWNLDFSNSFGKNKFDFRVENSNNASLGTASPTQFYAGGFGYSQNTTDLNATRSFDWLHSVNIAFGGELRLENYGIFAGEENSWINGGDSIHVNGDTIFRDAGAQVFPGFRPENELNRYRSNTALYLDIEANVTKKLLFGGAARYEIYSDFGSNLTYKLVGRYRIDNRISIRSGFSSGFRAPSLHQVYFNNIGVQFIDGEAVLVGTFNNESAVSKVFGIEPLKPELSKHLNAGITAKLLDDLSFTLDGYYIGITDRIVLSGRFSGAEFKDKLDPLNTGAAQFFTNAIDTRTVGLDAVVNYRRETGEDRLELSIAANYSNTQVDGKVKVSDSLQGREDVLFNREEISRLEVVQPNFKIASTVDYEIGRWSFLLRNTLIGRVKYVHPDDGDETNWVLNEFNGQVESRDQVFRPKLLTDLSASINIWKAFRLTLGGNNIFNIYPDPHRHSAMVNSGRFIYSRRVQQFGVQGTFLFIKMGISL